MSSLALADPRDNKAGENYKEGTFTCGREDLCKFHMLDPMTDGNQADEL